MQKQNRGAGSCLRPGFFFPCALLRPLRALPEREPGGHERQHEQRQRRAQAQRAQRTVTGGQHGDQAADGQDRRQRRAPRHGLSSPVAEAHTRERERTGREQRNADARPDRRLRARGVHIRRVEILRERADVAIARGRACPRARLLRRRDGQPGTCRHAGDVHRRRAHPEPQALPDRAEPRPGRADSGDDHRL